MGYALSEIITGGVASDVFNPVLDPLRDNLAGLYYTRDEIRSASSLSYTPSGLDYAFSLMGTAGVTGKHILETYKLGKKAFESDEEFIKDRYGVVNKELTDVVVDDFRLTDEGVDLYGNIDLVKMSKRASFAASIIALTGLTSQEVRSMRRGTGKYANLIEETLRGKSSGKTVKEKVDNANLISTIELGDGTTYNLNIDESKELFEIRKKELASLVKNPTVIKVKRDLTKEEYEDLLRDASTELAHAEFKKKHKLEASVDVESLRKEALKEVDERKKRLEYERRKK